MAAAGPHENNNYYHCTCLFINKNAGITKDDDGLQIRSVDRVGL